MHRLSYQVATNMAPITISDDAHVGRFQVKGQSGDNMVAVGIVSGGGKGGPMVFGVKRVSNESTTQSVITPQPMPRNKPEPLPTKSVEMQPASSEDHIRSHTTASTLSPGLAARLSQDLTSAVLGFRSKSDSDADEREAKSAAERSKAATLPQSTSVYSGKRFN